jgi:hypothetical protein
MDFRQSKLTKNEWISIEKPVDMKEKNILDMIVRGYLETDYKLHLHHVISEVIKLEHSEKDYYIYLHVLKEKVDKLKIAKLSIEISEPKKKLNGADTIRIQSYRKKQIDNIEYMILDMIDKFFQNDKKKEYLKQMKKLQNKLANNHSQEVKKQILKEMNKLVKNYNKKSPLTTSSSSLFSKLSETIPV